MSDKCDKLNWKPDADLEGCDLKGANLMGADLEAADLVGANLKGANLKGAIYDKATTCPDGSNGPCKFI